jgi:cyclopropane-fatty-acyl-phospholipid synthase
MTQAEQQHRVGPTAADVLAPITRRLAADGAQGWPFNVRLWDGSEIPSPAECAPTLVVRSRQALKRVLREPNELGLARAWVAGELDIEGGIERGLAAAESLRHLRLGAWDRVAVLAAALRLGAVRSRRLPVPVSEARLTGRRRSKRRDKAAIAYHYDIPDAFYELVLGPTRGYTCGYYADLDESLDVSQIRKFDRVCEKLELQPGDRLLDIGCGWGSLMIRAAHQYGARAVGVTISESQAEEVRRRIRAAGVSDQCEVRLCDWREIEDGPYDKIASVEMVEHVGGKNLPAFFAKARSLVAPGGTVFTQVMVRGTARRFKDNRFITRYVFPDSELVPFPQLLDAMTAAGLEIRNLESLRAHYPPTLRAWAANLNTHREQAIELIGIERVRVWDIYLAASMLAFERGALSVHQILAAAPPARHPRLLAIPKRGTDDDNPTPALGRRSLTSNSGDN